MSERKKENNRHPYGCQRERNRMRCGGWWSSRRCGGLARRCGDLVKEVWWSSGESPCL